MTTAAIEMKENEPWYKQWMVWMVITPPLTAVIAGIITINLAIQSDDGLVVDDYYKQGLGINQTLQRDHKARSLGLDANFFVEGKALKLRFKNVIANEQLKLSFIHPTQSQRDVKVDLVRFSENSFQAKLDKPLTGNWNLLLEPEDKAWRIGGRINLGKQQSSRLMPNLK